MPDSCARVECHVASQRLEGVRQLPYAIETWRRRPARPVPTWSSFARDDRLDPHLLDMQVQKLFHTSARRPVVQTAGPQNQPRSAKGVCRRSGDVPQGRARKG